MKSGVEFGADYIAIRDKYGEFVRWVIEEWKEDPAVVIAIAKATTLAGMGIDLRKYLKLDKNGVPLKGS